MASPRCRTRPKNRPSGRITFYEPVAKIAISGPFSERTLKDYAKQIRDGLLNAGIDRVSFTGARDEEIWATVPEGELRRLDLSVQDVATRLREETRDLPSGTVEGEAEVQLRTLAERRTPEEVARIEVKSDGAGNKVLLGDIAKVEPRFDDNAVIGLHQGGRAILLQVERAVTADTLKTMEKMKAYLERALPTLPESLTTKVYDIRGEYVTQRLGILIQQRATRAGAGSDRVVPVSEHAHRVLGRRRHSRSPFWRR